ncbi:RAD55 family ATPase [Methanocella sp. MCL-LM]|uniref:RAD55 family ATPase n=1 Tax=Methanocella sp. MCL-LM TaxID=3412035 RepID=UPI003C7902F2
MKTGIGGLDNLLSGGFVKGSTILISGSYGSGKTLLALQYAFYQAQRGDKVLYVSTSEPVFKIRQFAGNLSFFDESLVRTGYSGMPGKKDRNHSGFVEFVESSMGIVTGIYFNDVSSLMEEIRDMVNSKGIQHLIIDPITTLSMLYDSEVAMRKDILLMSAWLTRMGCTVLLTAEASDQKLLDVEKYLADCVIDLRSHEEADERHFSISIEKLRGNRQLMCSQQYMPGSEGIKMCSGEKVAIP